ncbi:MAG: HD domain-containing protein [Candidatus Aenigmarchaeota archaeon]|nr:HD domain-containing protein [Candidatus Aenigmarchaeota archaeon]
MKEKEAIERTKAFVRDSFVARPHYSFDHWSVMYNHSVLVQEIALKIAKGMECDRLVLSLAALLHDIGKTYEASPAVLHKGHKKFNAIVSADFLEGLRLERGQLRKVKGIISYKSRSAEMKIVKDADALALYADKRLYTLYIRWAMDNGLADDIKRKLGKFSRLHFEESKRLGRKWFERMKRDWDSTASSPTG